MNYLHFILDISEFYQSKKKTFAILSDYSHSRRKLSFDNNRNFWFVTFNSKLILRLIFQRVMVDEADVNEAMAGPQSRKRSPMDNRPGSPRDKRRQQETPPVRWPNKMNQNGGPLTGPINNKVPPDKNLSNQDVKANNVFPGHHGVKRKHSEGSDGVHKSRKSSKGLIDPQLARLQRLQNKGRLNRKHQPVTKTNAVNSSKNDFVSSILKEAVTSQTRTFSGQGGPLLHSNDNMLLKNKVTNSEAAEVFVDEVVKERGKGPSPRLLKKQLAREAMEENRLIRNSIFKEIRLPERSMFSVVLLLLLLFFSLFDFDGFSWL